MRTEAVFAACAIRGLEPRSKLLLMVLAIGADTDDLCVDGLDALMAKTGMSASSVNKHLYALGHAGLVEANFEGEHPAGIYVNVAAMRHWPASASE